MDLSIQYGRSKSILDSLSDEASTASSISWVERLLLIFIINRVNKKLSKLSAGIEAKISSEKQAKEYHKLYLVAQKLSKEDIQLQASTSYHFLEGRVIKKARQTQKLLLEIKEKLAVVLFPTPEKVDQATFFKESKRIKDFFDDLDDEETDQAYLSYHPDLPQ